MVFSDDVPNSYLVNWDLASNSSSTSDGGSLISHRRQSSFTKLCAACNSCRQARVRCGGGSTCPRCSIHKLPCHYSNSRRSGRTKAPQSRRYEGLLNGSAPKSPIKNSGNVLEKQQRASVEDVERSCVGQPSDTGGMESFPVVNSQDSLVFEQSNDFGSLDNFLYNFTTQAGTPNTDNTGYVQSGLKGAKSLASIPSSNLPVSPITSLGLKDNFDFALKTSPSGYSSPSATSTWDVAPSEKSTQRNSSLKGGCNCLDVLLSSTSVLYDARQNPALNGLDTVLQLARETSNRVSKYFVCTECTRESTNFIFTAILIQRVVGLLGNISSNGASYLASLKLGVGVFQLSDEDDLRHKKLLITSAIGGIDTALSQLGDSARAYQQTHLTEPKLGEVTPEMGNLNLQWVTTITPMLKMQLKKIVSTIESNGWGIPHAPG